MCVCPHDEGNYNPQEIDHKGQTVGHKTPVCVYLYSFEAAVPIESFNWIFVSPLFSLPFADTVDILNCQRVGNPDSPSTVAWLRVCAGH